jgi:hypothetical protein
VPPGIEEVKRRHARELMALSGILAVGIGRTPDGEAAIIVSVRRDVPEAASRVPSTLEGHPVVVQLSSEIRGQ